MRNPLILGSGRSGTKMTATLFRECRADQAMNSLPGQGIPGVGRWIGAELHAREGTRRVRSRSAEVEAWQKRLGWAPPTPS